MKKQKPTARRTAKPPKGTVTLTALLFTDDPAVEKELRRELAAYGITTAEQMRVVAMAESVWVKMHLHKYSGLRESILSRENPAALWNPTLFGIFACHTLARIEREIGTVDHAMRQAMISGYAIMWESAVDVDKLADQEVAQQRRRLGAVATKAKADKRRALVQSLLDDAAKNGGDLDVEEIARRAECSPDTVYRYVREMSRKRRR